MYRPNPFTRHALAEARWPGADEAAGSRWFSPIRVGPLALEARTWVPAMVPWRATDDGFVTPEVLEWYERFAEGRPAALVVEATGIRDVPSGPLLRAGHERFVPGLGQLVERVRRASGGHTRLLLQIIDFLAIRRRPDPEKYLRRFLAITDGHRAALGMPGASDEAIRARLLELPRAELESVLSARELEALDFGLRERVTDVELPHVRELPVVLPGLFADAAERAERAGFDGVELHYAHAYTMASFMSRTNTRSDGWGGDASGRVRLPLEVLAAVRARVDRRFGVGIRYLAEECIDGGSTLDDAVYFALQLARAGSDFLSLSRGGKFDDARQPDVGAAAYPYTGPSGWECMPTVFADARGPFGRNLAACARIRAAVRGAGFETPVVVSGGISTFEQAEAALRDGAADIVGAARQSLADPDWFQKVRSGRGSEVRRCEYTNYCEALDQKHRAVTCKLWDRKQRDEPDVRLDASGRRRLVAPPWRER